LISGLSQNDEQFEEKLEKDEFLTFGNKHILLETSMNYEFPFVRDYIYRLIQKGYRPIIAHPERYRYIFGEKNHLDLYETMQDWGVTFQLNLFSLVGIYGDQVRKIGEELIDNQLISYVSSDIHHPNQLKFFEQLQNSVFLAKLVESGNLKNNTLL
jgi:protein-tyrosine phosphatase